VVRPRKEENNQNKNIPPKVIRPSIYFGRTTSKSSTAMAVPAVLVATRLVLTVMNCRTELSLEVGTSYSCSCNKGGGPVSDSRAATECAVLRIVTEVQN